MSDVNSTAPRTDIPGEIWPEGDLPEQFGGQFTTLMPGSDTFILPMNLPQLWETQPIKDGRTQEVVPRLILKFTRDNPLVVEGGPRNGETMTCSFSTNPRPRGKKDDPTTPWVSDLAYMLEIGLGNKSRPKTPEALRLEVNKYAGKRLRLEHGLSAHCREDKVRYIEEQPTGSIVPDPEKVQGCGERYYTKDFKAKDEKGGDIYNEAIVCDCGAVVRGFPNVERFLAPLAGAGAAK